MKKLAHCVGAGKNSSHLCPPQESTVVLRIQYHGKKYLSRKKVELLKNSEIVR
jgi:hypothetical protein